MAKKKKKTFGKKMEKIIKKIISGKTIQKCIQERATEKHGRPEM